MQLTNILHNNCKKSDSYTIFSILIVGIQILLILFWVSMQGSLYWDVYYTLENANYMSQTNPSAHYIVYDEEFEEGKWISAEYVVETMSIERSEALYLNEPTYIARSILNAPYFSVLNITEAILSPGVFSRWPAVFINVVFFILTQIFLWKLVFRLSGNECKAMLSVLLYGFSGMAFSMSTYARFYVFTTMLLMIYTYLHLILWDLKDHDWIKAIGIEFITLVLVYWSIITSQLTLFYYVIFIIIFSITLLIKKRFVIASAYIIPIGVGGGTFLVKGSDYLWMLTHLREAFYSPKFGGPTLWVLDSFLTLNPFSFIERLAHMFLLIGRFAFGCWPVCLLFCIIVVYTVIKKKIFFFNSVIEWVIFLSVFMFILLSGGLRFYAQTRYSSYVFPLVAWIIAVVLYEYVNALQAQYLPKILLCIIVLSVIAFTVTGIRVDFVYSQDKAVINRLKEPDINKVIIIQQDQYNIDAEIIYAASVNVNENAEIMAIKADDMEKRINDLPDEFLLASRLEYEMMDKLHQVGYNTVWSGSTYCDHYYLLSLE